MGHRESSGRGATSMHDPAGEELEAIIEAVDRFEDAWRNGNRARIADFVGGVEPGRFEPLFLHLVQVEIELRRNNSESPSPQDYEAEWPGHRDLIREAFEADGLGSSLDGTVDCSGDRESEPDRKPLEQAGFRIESESATNLGPPELAGYQIAGVSGQGGLGIVYKAWHEKLRCNVAIKIIANGASVGRFRREAQLIAQIHSTHVVAIHDFLTLPDGRPALIMEHVEGIDLGRWMIAKDGPLDEAEVLPWMRHVAEGMQAAAEVGIIHRDLKPSNILIDSRRRAKVGDFGLGRGPAELSDDLTRSGDMLGTPNYMAPEQAEDPLVDTRADIYSFGAMFYHALTGVPPFDGRTPFSILYKSKTEPLVSPRSRNPKLSGWISDFLERCLAKSPADRFQTFAEVLRQLEQLSSDAASPWDTSNDPRSAPYLKTYKANRDSYLNGPPVEGECGRYEFLRGRLLRIIRGNLIDQKVDALVSSSFWDLPGDFGVSRDLLEAAGWEIRREATGLAPVRPGRVAVTSAGNLPARFIFHGVTDGMYARTWVAPSRDLIAEIMTSCFYHADSHNVQSIAFPLLGTGAAGFSRDVCLDTMFRFLVRTFLSGLTCVREARIVVYPL